jgi:modulator of FtsH protease
VAFGLGRALEAEAGGGHGLKPRGRNALATRRAVVVFAGIDAQQGARDLPQLLGHFDVERFEKLLIFELHRLLGEVLRQRFFAVAGLARDTAVPLEQFFLSSEQRTFDLLMIHHVSPSTSLGSYPTAREATGRDLTYRQTIDYVRRIPYTVLRLCELEVVVAEIRPVGAALGRSIEINRVLRNTYLLLGMTLAFSSLVTFVAVATNAPYLGFFPTLIGFFGLLFIVHRLANSAWGLLAVFAFTGFLGYTLGPMLSLYLKLPHGPQLVGQALGLTSVAFVGLSFYALTTRKDFSFLSGFLVIGGLVLLGGLILNHFTEISGLSLAISVGIVLFASALILFETSQVISGGETNYIRATVGLYVSIFNLFTSLLHLLGVAGDD